MIINVCFSRICKNCEEEFTPTNKYCRVCNNCKKEINEKKSLFYQKQRLLIN